MSHLHSLTESTPQKTANLPRTFSTTVKQGAGQRLSDEELRVIVQVPRMSAEDAREVSSKAVGAEVAQGSTITASDSQTDESSEQNNSPAANKTPGIDTPRRDNEGELLMEGITKVMGGVHSLSSGDESSTSTLFSKKEDGTGNNDAKMSEDEDMEDDDEDKSAEEETEPSDAKRAKRSAPETNLLDSPSHSQSPTPKRRLCENNIVEVRRFDKLTPAKALKDKYEVKKKQISAKYERKLEKIRRATEREKKAELINWKNDMLLHHEDIAQRDEKIKEKDKVIAQVIKEKEEAILKMKQVSSDESNQYAQIIKSKDREIGEMKQVISNMSNENATLRGCFTEAIRVHCDQETARKEAEQKRSEAMYEIFRKAGTMTVHEDDVVQNH